MATLRIENPDVQELAAELARRTGSTLAGAIKSSLRESLATTSGSERRTGRDPAKPICAVNWIETMTVVEARKGRRHVDRALFIFDKLGIGVLSFGVPHMVAAQEARRRYGKGRRRTALNLADFAVPPPETR